MARLFVYGTLAPGQPNEHVLSSIDGTWQPAQLNGRLLPQGWGADMGYPGLILDDLAPIVQGMVFTAEGLARHWPRLDDFEGPGYQRVETTVYLEDGSSVKAYVYALNEQG